jgi:hypothetical protein
MLFWWKFLVTPAKWGRVLACWKVYFRWCTKQLNPVESQNLVYDASYRNPITSVWTDVLKDDRYKCEAWTDPTPRHDVWSDPWVSYHDTCITIVFTTPSSHLFVICVRNAISTFTWVMTLLFTLHSPLLTFLTMPNCKDGSSGLTTTYNVVGDQSTSDSVISNWWLAIFCRAFSVTYMSSSGQRTHLYSSASSGTSTVDYAT